MAGQTTTPPLETPLCAQLGVRFPIIQAPICGASCAALAAAVSAAGGLGSFSATWRSLDDIRQIVHDIRVVTDQPFAANLVLDPAAQSPGGPGVDDRLVALLDLQTPVVSFFWGDWPSCHDRFARVRQAGAWVICHVGGVDEARLAAAAGADVIVAQGWEAGGHVRGTIATMVLVPQVVDAVPLPVVAAGGIVDGRGLVAALALGAAGVMMGTRFVATTESTAHPRYKDVLLAATSTDAWYTDAMSEGWPNAPHRVLRNQTLEMWRAAGSPPPGQRPGEGDIVAIGSDGGPLVRYSDAAPTREASGDIEELSMYAGQGCGLITTIEPAGSIVERVMAEANDVLQRLR